MRLIFPALLALAGCQTVHAPLGPDGRTSVHVITSGGFSAAFDDLADQYTTETGISVVTGRGPSMGDTANAIPARLARKEPADVVILARGALDKLVAAGQVQKGTEVDLGLSKIAVAVKDGAPIPDISSAEGVRSALLKAKSVAWSDSASGVYIQTSMLNKLGIASRVLPKGQMIPATPVGEIVASGAAEIGFQQLSELKPVKGIRIVGLLPDSLQKVTAFSAGIVAYSPNQTQARALIDFLASPRSHATIINAGLEPASRKANP